MLNCIDDFPSRLDHSVDVWIEDPARLWRELAGNLGVLDEDERRRHDALRFEADRVLFGSAHVFLRHVLSRYAPDRPPANWRFDLEAHGRPRVRAAQASGSARGLRFSLSHTEGLVAVAVARDCEVGVDVERIHRPVDLPLIAPSLLSGSERRWFAALSPEQQRTVFFNMWTLKEAVLKARGVGIAEGLHHIALVQSWQDPRAVVVWQSPLPAGSWHAVLGRVACHDAGAAPGYALSLVAARRLHPWGQPSPGAGRQVGLFDLRERPVGRDAAVLADALFLPVCQLAMARRAEVPA